MASERRFALRSTSCQKKDRKIVIIAGYLLIEILLFLQLILPWYYSQDAVNIRANLAYLSEWSNDHSYGDKIETSGIHAVRWPYSRALLYLCQYSDILSNAYAVKGYAAYQKTGRVILPSENSPFEPLSRLELTTEDPDINTIYENIKYDIAVCNPSTNGLSTVLQMWLQTKQNRLDSAQAAYNNMHNQSMACCFIFYTSLVMPIVLKFAIWLFRNLRSCAGKCKK